MSGFLLVFLICVFGQVVLASLDKAIFVILVTKSEQNICKHKIIFPFSYKSQMVKDAK